MTDSTVSRIAEANEYRPRPSDDSAPHFYGCDHTESYIDEPHSIVCVEGWMIDVDTFTEGYESHDFKRPCRNCNPNAFKRWIDSNGEDE